MVTDTAIFLILLDLAFKYCKLHLIIIIVIQCIHMALYNEHSASQSTTELNTKKYALKQTYRKLGNRRVRSWRLKVAVDAASLIAHSSLFHNLGATTKNELSPAFFLERETIFVVVVVVFLCV